VVQQHQLRRTRRVLAHQLHLHAHHANTQQPPASADLIPAHHRSTAQQACSHQASAQHNRHAAYSLPTGISPSNTKAAQAQTAHPMNWLDPGTHSCQSSPCWPHGGHSAHRHG
jgi:hypothetical protein